VIVLPIISAKNPLSAVVVPSIPAGAAGCHVGAGNAAFHAFRRSIVVSAVQLLNVVPAFTLRRERLGILTVCNAVHPLNM